MNAGLVLVGNCQIGPIADCLRTMAPRAHIRTVNWGDVKRGCASVKEIFADRRPIFFQSRLRPVIEAEAHSRSEPVILRSFPEIYFIGLHPDAVYATHAGARLTTSASPMNSDGRMIPRSG